MKEKLKEFKDKRKKRITRTTFTIAEVAVIAFIAILFGGVLGSLIVFSKNGNDKYLEEFVTTYDNVVHEYYKKLNKSELIDAAIAGMVNYLGDPYSTYMDEEDTEEFNQTVQGRYEGIGVSVSLVESKPTVVSIFENSPAARIGVQVGDVITKVDGVSVEGKSLNDVVLMIKKKDEVKLEILRGEEKKLFKISLDRVELPSVASKIVEKNGKKVGVITVSVFASNTYSQFHTHLKKLEKKKIDGLVIDVRDNPGGHLDQVTKIISLFLDKSKVIYQINSNGKKTKVYSTSSEKREYPISVLINKGSASASEILAGAMKESYGATLIGIKSYGKGTVQKEYSLSSGSSIKYTTETWLTPSGKSINKKGVEPDIEVVMDDKYRDTFKEEDDNQFQKALDVVTEDKKSDK